MKVPAAEAITTRMSKMMPVRTALKVCQMRRAVERVFPAI
jgi:hypothetical protein